MPADKQGPPIFFSHRILILLDVGKAIKSGLDFLFFLVRSNGMWISGASKHSSGRGDARSPDRNRAG
jgi:hypothetical protein